jgi:hypothetical protein
MVVGEDQQEVRLVRCSRNLDRGQQHRDQGKYSSHDGNTEFVVVASYGTLSSTASIAKPQGVPPIESEIPDTFK